MFAVHCLERLSAPYCLPTLADLRQVMADMGCPDRATQDVAIHSARKAGLISLEGPERPVSDEIRAAGIRDHGNLLVFAFLRD